MPSGTTHVAEESPEPKVYSKRHREDEWIDEIRIYNSEEAVLTCKIRERWKESHLSGSEWRFTYHWYRGDNPVPIPKQSGFRLRDALLRLYWIAELLWATDPDLVTTEVVARFYRKGHLIGSTSPYKTLLQAGGRLPWDRIVFLEQGDIIAAEEATKDLCHQPGCPEEAVVTYRIKQEYDHCGKKQESYSQHKRHFCERHKHRGDCALEDADSNYERIA